MIALVLTLALVSAAAPRAQADSAVVRLGTRPIVVLRATIGASTPAERAELVRRRLAAALREGASEVTTDTTTPGIAVIQLGGRPVFAVTLLDADSAMGLTLDQATLHAVSQLRTAVSEYREMRAPRALLYSTLASVAATLGLWLALRLLLRARRAMFGWMQRRAAHAIHIGQLEVVRSEQLTSIARVVAGVFAWTVGLSACYLWATFVLRRFALTRAWGEALGQQLISLGGQIGSALLTVVPRLALVVLIFIGARLLSRLLGTLFRAVEQGAVTLPGIHPETAEPTRRVLAFLVWLFALVVAFPYLPGSETEAFKGVSVFAGLLLTLGSSGVVGQAMSGLVLQYSRALREGDFVQIGETEGTVTDLGLMSVKLRTIRQVEVTIPAAVVLGTNVRNFSRLKGEAGMVISTSVTIGYDSPWRQVHALLLMAAERTAGLRREPAPQVRQTALSDFYVEYTLLAFIDEPVRKVAVLSDLHANIQDAFNEYGVQIMSPNYEADRDQPAVVPKEKWFAPPARPDMEPGPATTG